MIYISVGYIEKRGDNTFRLVVSLGSDEFGNRRKVSKTFKGSFREAEKELARFATKAEEEKEILNDYSKMTICELYDYWKKHYGDMNLSAATICGYDYLLPRISDSIGHIRINKIQPRHIQMFLTNLSESGVKILNKKERADKNNDARLAPSTIRKYAELLSCMFTRAVRWGFMKENPCFRVDMPKLKYKKKVIYEPRELQIFLENLEKESATHKLWALLAFTGGLRREEIFGLEWNHVDFTSQSIRVLQASIYVSKKGIILKETKTRSGKRVVSLPASVMALFKEHLELQNNQREQMQELWLDSNRIFTQYNGKPAHPHSFNSWLRDFCQRCNLPSIGPHALRHMSATYLIKSGADIRTVSGKLGHSRSSITLDIYSHLLPATERQTADTMENILRELNSKH